MSVIPVIGKNALVPWKEYQSRMPTDDELVDWWGRKRKSGIAVVTGAISNLVVIDIDEKERARDFFRKHREIIRTIVETRRGAHFAFAHPGVHVPNSHNEEFDVRGDRGIAVWPMSMNKRFVDGYGLKDLVPLPLELLPQKKNQEFDPTDYADDDRLHLIERAREYLHRIEGAPEGSGGEGKLMWAAGAAIQRFGLSVEEAWPLMLEYNERCEAPRARNDLMRKLLEAKRLKK